MRGRLKVKIMQCVIELKLKLKGLEHLSEYSLGSLRGPKLPVATTLLFILQKIFSKINEKILKIQTSRPQDLQ